MHAAASAGPGRHLLFPSTLTDTALRTVLSAPLCKLPTHTSRRARSAAAETAHTLLLACTAHTLLPACTASGRQAARHCPPRPAPAPPAPRPAPRPPRQAGAAAAAWPAAAAAAAARRPPGALRPGRRCPSWPALRAPCACRQAKREATAVCATGPTQAEQCQEQRKTAPLSTTCARRDAASKRPARTRQQAAVTASQRACALVGGRWRRRRRRLIFRGSFAVELRRGARRGSASSGMQCAAQRPCQGPSTRRTSAYRSLSSISCARGPPPGASTKPVVRSQEVTVTVRPCFCSLQVVWAWGRGAGVKARVGQQRSQWQTSPGTSASQDIYVGVPAERPPCASTVCAWDTRQRVCYLERSA